MTNESGRIYEHKAPFCKQLSVRKPLEYTPLPVYVSDTFRISTRSLSSGLCFQVHKLTAFAVLQLAVIKQRCITAGAPFWIGGELPVFIVRLHAMNRDARTVSVLYENM